MLYLGADHAGFKLKEFLKKYFYSKKIKYKDLGTYSEEPVDYPDIAFKVAKRVAKETQERQSLSGRRKCKAFSCEARGILVCGTGVGVCIAANRIKEVRAALGYDEYYAKMSREHNDANVLCLRGWNVDFKKQAKIADIWLKTKFDNVPRRRRRNAKLK